MKSAIFFMENQAQQQQQAEKAKQMEEKRQQILNSILSGDAKERLGRIRLVKPEKARNVEDLLIQMAQQRQLSGPVEDAQLLDLLNRVSLTQETSVKIKRRGKMDEGWDNDDEGW